MLKLALAAMFVSQLSVAAETAQQTKMPIDNYKGVLLEKIVGGVAKLKKTDKVSRCEIKATHPKIKSRKTEIEEMIIKADNAQMGTALHIMAQVPSIEIYAYKVVWENEAKGKVKTSRVLLLKDHNVLETRGGEEAQKLIDIVHEICPNPAIP
jgi:hypothetical protein